MKVSDVLIIGGGPGGRTAARTVKGIDPGKKVILIKDEEVNANRCILPYVFDGTVPLGKAAIPNSLITGWGVDLMIDEVLSIDAKNKRVRTRKDEVGYQHLVLATGAVPVIPRIPGAHLGNVFVLRTLKDASMISERLEGSKSVVVIGGGYIGIELSATLRKAGFHVTLIEALEHCLQNAFDIEFCEEVEEKLKSNGIRLIMRSPAKALDGMGVVRTVRAGDAEIEADLVIFSVGVRPNISLARESRIRVNASGIQVDEAMKTNFGDIYAVGGLC